MKLDVKIEWLIDDPSMEIVEGESETVTVDCDYIETHDDLVNAISDVLLSECYPGCESFVEGTDFRIVNEEQFWSDMDCPASEITNPAALNESKPVITKEKVKKALQILIDNGIEEDEAGTVLQALGYALLDVELESMIEEEA